VHLQATYQSLEIPLSIAELPQNGKDLIVIGNYPPSDAIKPFMQPFNIDFNPSTNSNAPSSTPAIPSESLKTESPASLTPAIQVTLTPFFSPPGYSGNEFLVPGFGRVPSKGFSYVLFSQSDQRNILVLLAQSQEKLIDLLKLLNSSSMSGCMIQNYIAVCPGGVPSPDSQSKQTPTPSPTSTTEPTAAG
jgi:hypothetical protein